MRLVEGFVLRDVLGQATVVGEGVAQVNFNKLITLNETAAFLWRSVEGKDFEVSDIAALLVERYGIEAELADADSAAIVSQWKELGLAE